MKFGTILRVATGSSVAGAERGHPRYDRRMRTLLACVSCGVWLALLPAQADAGLLPGIERQTTTPGCPLGFVLLPGTKCPPSELIEPENAERDAAANPRPPGAPVTGTPAPYSSHSMVYACCTPAAQKQRAFAAARASGAGYVRLDVNLRGIFTAREGRPRRPEWDGVDQIAALGRRYRLRVVAVLTHVPDHITRCVANSSQSCPAADAEAYGRYAALIADRLRGVATKFEIVNEPDGPWAFKGSPQEYARMLDAAYRHIKHRIPRAQVLLGGLMYPDKRWITAMLDTPGVDAIHSFDIANIHLRGRLSTLRRKVRRWRRYFAERGFHGPLWVTEHGYPSNTRFQYDRRFRGAQRAQAAYLRRSLPALRAGGARQVFVTLRDSWPTEFIGEYASEGVISLGEGSPFPVRPKPAFVTVKRLNTRWRRVQRFRTLRLREIKAAKRAARAGHRAQARRLQRLAHRYARRIRALA